MAQAKSAAIQDLQAAYSGALAKGITVTSGSLTVTLAASASDQQAFNNLLMLLNTAPMPPTIPITDRTGNVCTVTVEQYYDLIGKYGQQIAGLWGSLATAKASVASVSGTAQLSKITLQNPTGQ